MQIETLVQIVGAVYYIAINVFISDVYTLNIKITGIKTKPTYSLNDIVVIVD
jgi:hypothetical protein